MTTQPYMAPGLTTLMLKLGSAAEVAKQLKVSRQAIHLWLKQGYVPPDRAVEIEKKYGIQREELVSRKLLRLLS